MARKEKREISKSPSLQNDELDSDSPAILKTFIQTFSMKKTKQKEEPCREDTSTASNTKSASSDVQGTTTSENGLFGRFSNIRSSFLNLIKSPDQETPQSDSKKALSDKRVERENLKGCNSFILNIPAKPLATMQIDELLRTNNLEEAYQNLLSLRQEFQREQAALGKKPSQVPLTNKETNLHILYGTLRTKLCDTVCESCLLPSYNTELLMYFACIVEEEEKREGSPGGIGGWRDAWKTAVQNGISGALKAKNLDIHEQKASSLETHLANLGKHIVEQLEKAKAEIVALYPPSFNVFETYVLSCHEFAEEHLKGLLGNMKELNDFYAMLNFITNCYHSETIFGSASLLPEMENQNPPTFSNEFLDQIKKAYLHSLDENLLASLDDKMKNERENVWKKKRTPIMDGRFLTSEIHMDVHKMIAAYVNDSEKIDVNLKIKVLCRCLEKLKHFPKRFEGEFSKQNSFLLNSDVLDGSLWAKYHIAYINSFSSLQELMKGYREISPSEVDQLGVEIDSVITHLKNVLLEQFKSEVKPYMLSLMTKTWLNTDADFQELINRIESYSGYNQCMRHPHAQSFSNEVHYHVVKEYVSELLEKKYSCKGKKKEIAAAKIKEQWNDLIKVFQEMGSNLAWLHPLGDQLSKIIEQEKEKEIKKHIKPLIESYPDITKKHLSAIMYFRDCTNWLSMEKNQVIQHFNELKLSLGNSGNAGKQDHTFFSEM